MLACGRGSGPLHGASHGTYGRPRIQADRLDEGWRVSGKRVARLMRADGLRGVARRKGAVTTAPAEERRPQPDLVERDFTAAVPDQLYVADITYSVPSPRRHPGRCNRGLSMSGMHAVSSRMC